MKASELLRIELRHFFEIRTDLVAAVKAAAQEDIEHHLDELFILRLHTESDRLKLACTAVIAEHATQAHVVNA